ncbi:succinyl-CoA:3-oxo-acid CoA-transferase [Malassezia pachydermatis]|uniref:Succinyl-CoA:3-ketoacid-coenzyme A transferase n=1 Tax=Malassezia pachydermatis TaxID=77020 RepID=A0A0M8MN82_9BASI|nr:succinyl- :3-ketoacid-coenzyme a transferase [Malassezia pachydermatis]KOS14978.1 succinyl- :3-ketoacid-coenzyme a transferase [Malassezia pachydermatis]
MLASVRSVLRKEARVGIRHFSAAPVRFQVVSSIKILEASEAVKDIKSGDTVLVGGFDLSGTPRTLLTALGEYPDVKDLRIISNNMGTPGHGIGILARNGQIGLAMSSYVGGNREFTSQYNAGKVSMHLCPQGTLAEKIRAGGYGIPAFYTPTGYGTAVETGEIVVRYEPRTEEEIKNNAPMVPKEYAPPREVREFDGRKYLLEKAVHGDFALVYAKKADKAGNIVFHGNARNFNDVMARNARITIVEAEEIVEIGEIDPDEVQLPGVFVNRIVKATLPMELEKKVLAKKEGDGPSSKGVKKETIAARAAKEFSDGMYANLGIGLPDMVPNFLPEGVNVHLQCENGLLGCGPYPATEEQVDPSIVNAGKESITTLPGSAFFDSSDSFGIIRGGHLDITMLGALQVTANGDLANYMIPGKLVPGMGGAMDLVSNPDNTRVIVLTEHVDKHGRPKIVAETKLPKTGVRCVNRIITDLAVFDVDREKGGLTLVELQPGVTEEEVRKNTDAPYKVALKQ